MKLNFDPGASCNPSDMAFNSGSSSLTVTASVEYPLLPSGPTYSRTPLS